MANGIKIVKRDNETNIISYKDGKSNISLPITINSETIHIEKLAILRTNYSNGFLISDLSSQLIDGNITYNSKTYELGCRVCIKRNDKFYDCLKLLSIPEAFTNVTTTHDNVTNDPHFKKGKLAITDRDWTNFVNDSYDMGWFNLNKTQFEIDNLFWYKSNDISQLPNLPSNVVNHISTQFVCAYKMLMTSAHPGMTSNTQMPTVLKLDGPYSLPTSALTYIYGAHNIQSKYGTVKEFDNLGFCPILTTMIANPTNLDAYRFPDMVSTMLTTNKSSKVVRSDFSTTQEPFNFDEAFYQRVVALDPSLGYDGIGPFGLTYGNTATVIYEWWLVKIGTNEGKVYFIGQTIDNLLSLSFTADLTLHAAVSENIDTYYTDTMANLDGTGPGRDVNYLDSIQDLVRDIAQFSPQRIAPDLDWINMTVASGISKICVCSQRIPEYKKLGSKISVIDNDTLTKLMPLDYKAYQGTHSKIYLVDLTKFIDVTRKDLEQFFNNTKFYWWCQWIGTPQIISRV